jgi:hypothetical protein
VQLVAFIAGEVRQIPLLNVSCWNRMHEAIADVATSCKDGDCQLPRNTMTALQGVPQAVQPLSRPAFVSACGQLLFLQAGCV